MKIAQTLALYYDIVKILITEEFDLLQVNFKRAPHTFTVSQKLERVKISRKLFRQLNKFQVNNLARVTTGMKHRCTLKIGDPQCG
jgi:hypothetical protein